jgi:hypothetical protein
VAASYFSIEQFGIILFQLPSTTACTGVLVSAAWPIDISVIYYFFEHLLTTLHIDTITRARIDIIRGEKSRDTLAPVDDPA